MLLLSLVSCLLIGENKSSESANTGKFPLFFQMQTSSDPLLLQSDIYFYINYAFKMLYHRKQPLSFQCTHSFYVGGQLEKCGGQIDIISW